MDVGGAKEKVFIPVQIPQSAVPGGSFEYTTPGGRVILVSVPHNASPGSFIDVCISEEDDDEDIEFKVKRSTIGAAVAGILRLFTIHAQLFPS